MPLQHNLDGCPVHLKLQMVELSSEEWPEMHMAPTMPPAQAEPDDLV